MHRKGIKAGIGYLRTGGLHPNKASLAFDVCATKKWQSHNRALHVQKHSTKVKIEGRLKSVMSSIRVPQIVQIRKKGKVFYTTRTQGTYRLHTNVSETSCAKQQPVHH
jgi:hypothetical protein